MIRFLDKKKEVLTSLIIIIRVDNKGGYMGAMMQRILWLLLSLLSVQAFYFSIRRRHHFSLCSSTDVPKKMENDVAFQEFMSGPEGKPWRGTREILKRRKQVPNEEYGPQDVCKVVLSALQSNDDPQLDHGACVALEFKSPNGVLASTGLDPAGYGRFIRSSEYSNLIDFKSLKLLGQAEQLRDSLSVRQSIEISNWVHGIESIASVNTKTLYDFYLSKVGNCWLIDAILIKK